MNLIERAVETRNQLERLEYDYNAGKVTLEELDRKLKIYLLKIKQEENLMKIATVGKESRSVKLLTGALNPQEELINCREQKGFFISREMCLDYSGSSSHMENCQTCSSYRDTRSLLL